MKSNQHSFRSKAEIQRAVKAEMATEEGFEKAKIDVLENILPSIVRRLVEERLLDEERLSDIPYVLKTASQYASEFQIIQDIDSDFIEAAQEAIISNKPSVAVVLIATIVEQKLNVFYRQALWETRRLNDGEITEVIRGLNLRDKLGWLITLITGSSLDDDVKKRLLELADLRNQIVHYKAVPSDGSGTLDEGGSHGSINKQVERLDLSELLDFALRLQENLDNLLEEIMQQSPSYRAAQEFVKTWKRQ